MIHCLLEKQSGSVFRIALFLTLLLCAFAANSQTVDCSISANCTDPYCQFAANIEKGCNCFDNIDNDGDGRTDKADSNCATYYGLAFVGGGSDCSIVPPGANTPFDLVNAPITSSQNTSDTQSKVSVGDVDGDGIPDAVVTSKWNSEIRVIATAPGQADGTAPGDVKSDFKTTGQGAKIFSGTGGCKPQNLLFEHENLIADIDGDGKAELFGVVSNRGGNPSTPPTCFFLVAFTYAANSLIPMYNAIPIGTDRPGTFGIADMDGDGKAEIYLRDRIYAAETGALLATGNGNWDLDITAGPVAVNVTGDSRMELVSGTKIFSIPDLSNRNPASPQNLTLVADMNTIDPTVQAYVKLAIDPVEYGTDTHSMTSVADIDRDGNMDVVISGALGSVSGPTTVFYWNVAKGTVSYYVVTDPLYVNGWPWGTGRVNLGDANGDGRTDLTFIAGSYLHSLTTDAGGNLIPLWTTPRTINDTRSGVLTVSIYDFNNDGNPEVVYRDSQELAVVDGATGQTKLWSAVCQSHTYTEGPVIADVNGDGATDICVPCNTNNSFDINDPIQQQALGQFRLYYSSGNEWLPTRKVWNQPGYFVVNVNDDLTLPFPQLDQNLVFGNADCPNGLPGPQMPMNVFLNQVPYLSANGCPVYPAPDLAYFGDNPDNPGVDVNGDGVYTPAVEIIPPICGDLAFQVRFNIINLGDLPISGTIPVSFFKADPTVSGTTLADRLYTTNINIVNLAVDSILTTAYETFDGTGGTFRLYIVLNNDGSTLPVDTLAPSPTECRLTNNVYSLNVIPDPFTTKIEKIADNFKCANSAPDNGELRVRIFKAGVEVTDYSQYAFQWYTGTAASYTPIAGATNYNLTGLAEGDYTAIVTNTAKGCAGLPVDTTVLRLGVDPDVVINVISHQTVCNPPNGELQAVIAGGNVGFTFEWFDIALNPLGVTGPNANNLVAGNYLVRVSKDGCTKNSLPQTVDGPVVPDAQAATLKNVEDCLNPNSGSVTATALFNGVPQDPANYTFDWYFYDNATSTRGSILPGIHGTGETRTALPVGFYQVVVTDNVTQCAAVQAPITEIASATIIPTAVITELAPQTSCDPANPNGRLQGAVNIGGVIQDPSTFTFEWFEGDNTVTSHTTVSGVKGSIAESVKGGGLFYTLRVTTANNCSDTEKLIITENLQLPVATLTTTDNGICDPALATSTYNGTVNASVTFGGVAVTDFTNYQITWHNGSLVTDAVITGETAPLLDERNGGFYTIVVERTDLSCTSAPVTAQVKNATTLPAITSTAVASTNCPGGAPNGTMSANVGGVTSGYTFQWYQGNTTSSPVVPAANGGNTANAFNLQGGQNYTVLVINTATGCSNTQTTALPDQSAVPILSLAQTPNSVCDTALTNPPAGYNGSVTASATYKGAPVADFSSYVFEWHNGSSITDPVNSASTTRELKNQKGGFYTVKATISGLNCVSAPVTIEIQDEIEDPEVGYSFTNSSQCAGPPNGKANAWVIVGADTVTAGYLFEWFSGESDDLSDPSVTFVAVANGQYTPRIFGVQGSSNDYTVRVTSNATGCKQVQMMHLHHKPIKPELTITEKDNSGCTVFDGSITATLKVPGPATYFWYEGDNADPAKLIDSTTTNVLTGLKAGDYTVVVRDDVTLCKSKEYEAEIDDDDVVLPDVTTSSTPSTNCAGGTPDGTTTATASGAVSPSDYAYQWYAGNSFTPGQEVPDANGGKSAATSGLQGGQNYSVQVTIVSTGCKNKPSSDGSTVFVGDNSELPVLGPLSSTPNTSCTATGTGTASAGTLTFPAATNVPSPYTGFTFKWVDATSATIGTTPAINTLLAGTYTLTATHTTTNCTSSPVSVAVVNSLDIPDIVTGSTPSTNCTMGAGLEDGRARAVTVDGAPATTTGFSFSWAGPASPLFDVSANPTRNDIELTNVQGGAGYDYTVTVTNNTNGCVNTAIINVPDAKVLPVITLAATDNTICAPAANYDGTVTATVTNLVGALTDYTFAFGSGMVAGTPLASPNHNQYTKLNGGPTAYTATATHTPTGCVSSQVSIVVNNNQNIPDITTGNTPSTNCTMGAGLEDGRARAVTVDAAPATTTGYSFSWAGPTTPLFDVSANPTRNDIELTNVQGGAGYDYTLTVTNTGNGCVNTAIVNVPDAREIPTLTLTPQPNTICDPVKATLGGNTYNGEILASVNAVGNYAAAIAADFTFTWSTGLNGIGQNLLSNQNGGTYSVTVVHTNTGCESAPQSAQVVNNLTLPAITMSSTPSQNCAGGAADGIASVTNIVPNAQNYDYRWFDGNSTSGPAGPTTLNTTAVTNDYINVQGGMNGASMYQYTVEVTILQTGCVNTATVAVDDDSQVPILGPLTKTDNTLCTVAKNGTATVSTLDYRGVAVPPANYGDFTFTWSGGTQGPPETITALPAGTYTLTVRHINDQCESNPVSVTISDDLFFPPIDVVDVDQTSCDPSTPNGSLTASIDETALGTGTGVIAGYTFTWVDDVTSASTNSNTISGLKGNQTYTITAVRVATGCSTIRTVFLDEALVVPTVATTITNLTRCAPPDGKLVATPSPGVVGDYEYFWYDGSDAANEDAIIAVNNTGLLGVVTTNTYDQLQPGEYSLVVRRISTQCKSAQVVSTIANNAPAINPVAENTSIPGDCATNSGLLTGAVRTSSLVNFSGAALTDALTLAAPIGLAVNDQIIIQRDGTLALPVGIIENQTYFVETIDITGTIITLKDGAGTHIDITASGDGKISNFVSAGYTFNWYEGVPNGTVPADPIDYFTNPPNFAALTPSEDNPNALNDGLFTGVYTVEATDNATGCKNFVSHTLPFVGSQAVIRISKTNSQVCNPPNADNGSVVIQIEHPAAALPTDTYNVTLYLGTTVISNIPAADDLVNYTLSTALSPGSYVVEVIQNYAPGCPIYQDVIIGRDAFDPVISLASAITANTACDPTQFDGRIDINVDKDPADLTVGTTYDISMAPDPNAAFPLLAQPVGIYSASNLGPNTYTFTVTASTGCSSAKSFTIINDPVKSELSAANISVFDAEYCDATLEQSARVVVNQLNIIGGGAENISDYRFDWYTDAALTTNIYSALGDPTPTKGGEELSNVAPAPPTPVTNGPYWVVTTKMTDVSGTGGIGCSSTPYSLTIAANKIIPAITLTPFGDTSCDPAFFEGSIEVDVATASGPGMAGQYSYTWAPTGAAGQPANLINQTGVNNLFSNINDGTYTLTALNQVTGCSSTLSTTLIRETPPSFTLDAVATNLTSCGPFDGRIDNLQVFVNGAGGTVADFDYVWFRSDLLPASMVLDGQNPGVPVDIELTLGTYPAIALDKYFVKAIRKAGGAGIGCESTPLRKDILDERVYPQVTLSQIASTACDGNFDGQITVAATTASGPGVGANYDFVWTNDPDGLAGPLFSASDSPNTASPYSTPSTDLIGEGTYVVNVTNVTTSCATTGTIVLQKNTVPMEIVGVTPTPVDVCLPMPVNGAGTVTDVTIDGAPGNSALFTYTWDDDPAISTPFITNDPALTQNGLDIGIYYVRARRNAVVSPATPGLTGSGCVTAPVPFEVLDKRITPTVILSQVSSTACDGNFDGQITVTATTASGPGAGANYDFVWTNDPDGLAGPLYSASDSPNTPSPYSTPSTDLIGEGTYVVNVTNVTTSCATSGTIVLQKNTVPMEIIGVTPTPVDVCLPMPVNGSGTVTDVTISGVSSMPSFDFAWDDDVTFGSPLPGITATQGGLDIGTYYVRAQRKAAPSPATPGVTGSGCTTTPVVFEVLDQRVYPLVSTSTLSNTSCDNNFDGQITISASTASGPGAGPGDTYDFVWTSNPGGAVVVNNAPNVVSPHVTGGADVVGPGSYGIRVRNFATQCFTDVAVTLLQESIPMGDVSATPTPVDVCAPLFVNGTGTVTAVSSGPTTDFTYTWSTDPLMTSPFAANDPALTQDSLAIGTYYVYATRNAVAPVSGSGSGSGCSTAPVSFTVLDKRIDPVVLLTPIENTACDTNYEGGIQTDVTTPVGPGAGSSYTYVWSSTSSTTPPANAAAAGNELLGGLQEGDYTLTATNNTTQCFAAESTTIELPVDVVHLESVAVADQQLCNPDGSITVTDVSVNEVSDAANVSTNFTYTWYQNDLTTVIPGVTASQLNVGNHPTIGAGTYHVKAIRNSGTAPGSGCESDPVRVEIRDVSIDPSVTYTTTANTACDNNFDAQIVLTATAPAPGNASTYDFTWLTVPPAALAADAAGVANVYSTTPADRIGPGSYVVEARNTVTNCRTETSVIIVNNLQPVEILTVTKQDQVICYPDGQIQVSTVKPALPGDYTYSWYRDDLNTTALTDAGNITIATDFIDASNYPAMGADTYFIVATKNASTGSGCSTPPFRVNIEDLHIDPNLEFTFSPNSSCNPANPNGQLIATAMERDGTTDNYTFAWTLNAAALPPVTTQTDASPNSQLDDAFEGQYALLVTNTVTGCTFTSGIAVNLDLNVSLPNIITVDTVDPTNCIGDGSAEVTAISIGGGPPITGAVLGTDFQYEWYDDQFDPANQLANTAPLLNNIRDGKYYVRVQDLTTDCKSSPTEVVILDTDIVYPVVTITQTSLQVRCVSNQGTAELQAFGDGNTDTNPSYQFSWFNNLDTSGPAFSNTSTISNQLQGEYSVLVTNNATGCSASDLYVIRDDSERFLPAISLNTEPRIDCVDPNGILQAREVGYDPNNLAYPYPSANYSAEFYAGANPDVSQAGTTMTFVPGFNRNWRETNLDIGAYTVKVNDNNTGCIATKEITIDDGRVLPVVTITEDNPLINCDPARPNGQLSATADGGQVGGYLFDWYSGTTASGAVMGTNNKLIGLPMGDYTVRVTNDFTNCFADATSDITDGRLLPPTPTARLIFDRTRCDLPDGWVAANVGGVTVNYSFDWYDGTTLKNAADFNGVNYKDRDIGFYTVTAMDVTTGCISLPTSIEVKDLRVIPEVIVHTTPSFCDELPGQVGGTGTAEIELVPSNVVTDEVTWSLLPNTNTIGIGSYLTGIFPGSYQANVMTSYGCEAVGVGEVATEVFSYNLVSNNADQKNDNFRIDCITQFPNNNVKIFNRAGILVYEGDGYDNNNVVFKGIGENGIYTIGNELPVGTYFYVIDKGDGSKPKTGYLELVR